MWKLPSVRTTKWLAQSLPWRQLEALTHFTFRSKITMEIESVTRGPTSISLSVCNWAQIRVSFCFVTSWSHLYFSATSWFFPSYLASCQRHCADVSVFFQSHQWGHFSFERFVDSFGAGSFAVVMSRGGTIPVCYVLYVMSIVHRHPDIYIYIYIYTA